MDYLNTNICALSTPQGSGAIGIIRVSGPDSIEIVELKQNINEKFNIN